MSIEAAMVLAALELDELLRRRGYDCLQEYKRPKRVRK